MLLFFGLWRCVTGDSDGECPAAEQDEQECAEEGLGSRSAQSKVSAS